MKTTLKTTLKTALIAGILGASGQAAAATECQAIAGFSLCGEWIAQGNHWAVSGDATIEAAGVTLSLPAADLSVSIDPPAFIGEVDFALPAFGPLAGWSVLDSQAPRAQIQMGLGAGLDEIELGGEPLTLVDDQPYLVYDIDRSVMLSMNGLAASASAGPSTKVVIAPLDPLIYLEGEVVDQLTMGLVSDGAVGVSLNGMLPWSSSLQLFDGEGWANRDVSAHLYASGTVQLGQYPVYVSSTVAIDLGQGDEGAEEAGARAGGGRLGPAGGAVPNAPAGVAGSPRVGVNGELAIGWDKGPVSLTLPIGEGSVVYDAAERLLMVHGELDTNPFAGTPLAPLFSGAQGGTLWGHYRGVDEFTLHVETDGPVLGFPASELEITLTDERVAFGGLFEPSYGDAFGDQSVRFSGHLKAHGGFRLNGTASLNLGGIPMADAELTWTNSGLAVQGVADIPGGVGHVEVAGSLQTDGQFSLSGTTEFSPLGLPLANATVAIDNSRAFVAGRMEIPSMGAVDVHGDVHANGHFELVGSADLDVFGLSLSDAEVTVRHDGIEVDGRLHVPGLSTVRVRGAVGLDGSFSLSGDADLEVMGFELAAAHVEFGPRGLQIEGRIDARIAEGRIAGSFATIDNAAYQMGMTTEDYQRFRDATSAMGWARMLPSTGLLLRGDMTVRVPVPGGQRVRLTGGRVTVTNSGVRARGTVDFKGARVDVSGSVNTSGSISLKGDAGFSIKVAGTGVSGDLEVTVSNTKFSGKVSGKACINVLFDKVCKSASAAVSSNGNISLDMPSPVPDLHFSIGDLF